MGWAYSNLFQLRGFTKYPLFLSINTKGAVMSVDNVQGLDKTVTYIKGKPVLVDQKTSEKTTGSIMVSNETTLTSYSKTNPNEVVIFPKHEKAVKENGEIVFSKDMTDEQIENLKKLKDAQEFMKTYAGKKLAESMLNQQTGDEIQQTRAR